MSNEAQESNFRNAQKWSDALALRAAKMKWTKETTQKCLTVLAASSADFEEEKISSRVQARRAERLVLGLDRLSVSLGVAKPTDAKINQLFKSVQSLPDFNPTHFSSALKDFAKALPDNR